MENDELQTFIWDENEGLLKFWGEIYQNFFKSWDLIKSSTQISKDHITIQSIYQIYLITGWKTNLEELSPMQKVHLTTNILASYGWPMELWWTISDIIDKITTNKLEVDSDVKNILFSVWKYLINASIDAAKFVWKVWLGMSTEHKIYSLWFIFILGKLPIYKKRGSLW